MNTSLIRQRSLMAGKIIILIIIKEETNCTLQGKNNMNINLEVIETVEIKIFFLNKPIPTLQARQVHLLSRNKVQ